MGEEMKVKEEDKEIQISSALKDLSKIDSSGIAYIPLNLSYCFTCVKNTTDIDYKIQKSIKESILAFKKEHPGIKITSSDIQDLNQEHQYYVLGVWINYEFITKPEPIPVKSISELGTSGIVVIPKGGSYCKSLEMTRQEALDFLMKNHIPFWYDNDTLKGEIYPGDSFKYEIKKVWSFVK